MKCIFLYINLSNQTEFIKKFKNFSFKFSSTNIEKVDFKNFQYIKQIQLIFWKKIC